MGRLGGANGSTRRRAYPAQVYDFTGQAMYVGVATTAETDSPVPAYANPYVRCAVTCPRP